MIINKMYQIAKDRVRVASPANVRTSERACELARDVGKEAAMPRPGDAPEGP